MSNSLTITLPDGKIHEMYKPHPAQILFHQNATPNLIAIGNRGGGKSQVLRFDAHMRALSVPGASLILVRKTYPDLLKSHIIYIKEEMNLLGGQYHATDHIAYYPNGSRLFLSHVSSEADALNLLSAEFLAAYFDELSVIPWEYFVKLCASVRVKSGMGLTAVVRAATNPLGPSAEDIRKYFVDHDVDPEEDPEYNPVDWAAIRIDRQDNPYIDQEQYIKRFAGMPEHIRRAWLYGEFSLENALFDFRPSKNGKPYHVIHDIDLPKILKVATIYRTIDAGWFPDPTVVLWIAHLGNRHIVFNEKIWYKTIAAEIAEDIKVEDERLGIKRCAITFCLPLDAPIWMGDFTFKPLSEIKVGDTVIGTCNKKPASEPYRNFRKGKSRRTNRTEDYLRRVKVTAIHRTRQEVFKITTESGRTLFCTSDHRWLSGTKYSNARKRYIRPKKGSKIVHVVDNPGLCPDVNKAAWLGGIYDGEGCRNYIAQSKDHNPEVYAQIYTYLADLGFEAKPVYRRHSDKKYESGIRFNGGFAAAVKFANWIPSVRFYKSADRYMLISKYKNMDTVISIESCGVQDVGCLTTESGDFVAYGYVTSNCDPTMDINTTADIRTIKEIYEANGIPMECSINDRERFASAMHTALAEEADENTPRIQFYVNGREGCPYLARTIPQMRYNPKRPLAMDDHKEDHAVVACCYYLMSHASDLHKDAGIIGQIKPWMREKIGKRFVLGNDNVRDTSQ